MDTNAKFLVVGAGFSGASIAERIAEDLGEQVLVIDSRSHIAGNCFSKIDPESGVEFHQYGPHIFHTSNESIWKYLNRFTKFNSYIHRGYSKYKGEVYTIPINLGTINQYYKKNFSPEEAKKWIESEIARDAIANPQNLEEKAISLIGKPLYEAFIKGYTQKQWETDPRKLPANIITRLPVRFEENNRYFNDTYEGIPIDGYTKVFENILKHPKITVQLNVDYFQLKEKISPETIVIYTGPIDRYFNYRFGILGWRTVDFENEVVATEDYQKVAIVNYADAEIPYTRVHEYKHFHPERKIDSKKSFIRREYSRFATKSDEPYYPIGREEDKATLALYQAEAAKEKNVFFSGRLGTYKYLDMHQALGAALLVYERDIRPRVTGQEWKPLYSSKSETK